jgi:hypothetical protein
MTARHRGRLPVRTRSEFAWHVAGFILFAAVFITLSLGIGVVGYHAVVGLPWIDSLLNASMILTGMGPVDVMPDEPSKVFASLYALFSSAVYPAVTALILYPFLHRMLAVLHLQAIESAQDDK